MISSTISKAVLLSKLYHDVLVVTARNSTKFLDVVTSLFFFDQLSFRLSQKILNPHQFHKQEH